MNAFKRLSYFFLPIPFAAVAVTRRKSIRIGYPECVSATNSSRGNRRENRQLKWYFRPCFCGRQYDGWHQIDLHAMDKPFTRSRQFGE